MRPDGKDTMTTTSRRRDTSLEIEGIPLLDRVWLSREL
jgi:hypothetical protein